MKRLFNNRTIENTSSEKTLQQGRLANMRTLTLRRLFGLAGLTIMLGAVAFVAYGATVTGTDRGDVITASTAGAVSGDDLFGLGGDDSITVDVTDMSVFAGPGDDNILATGSSGGSTLFGEDGDDTIRISNSGKTYTVNGGRGDDFVNLATKIAKASEIKDGPGSDTIVDNDGDSPYTIMLVADNEQDTVLLNKGKAGGQTIRLTKGSGRDVIDCGDDGGSGDVVFLNGNRKATDTKGNNLRQAALLGGTAESGCDTIIP